MLYLDVLLLDEDVDASLVGHVVESGYDTGLSSDEAIALVGRDPFLVAYAFRDPTRRTVVTTEVSKPTKQGANRHVPDVCRDLKVRCCNTYDLIRELDFKTGWRR